MIEVGILGSRIGKDLEETQAESGAVDESEYEQYFEMETVSETESETEYVPDAETYFGGE